MNTELITLTDEQEKYWNADDAFRKALAKLTPDQRTLWELWEAERLEPCLEAKTEINARWMECAKSLGTQATSEFMLVICDQTLKMQRLVKK